MPGDVDAAKAVAGDAVAAMEKAVGAGMVKGEAAAMDADAAIRMVVAVAGAAAAAGEARRLLEF